MDRAIADTCVLIDLQRQNAAAERLQDRYPDVQLELSFVAAAEFLIGFDALPEQGLRVLAEFNVKPVTSDTLQLYARIWNRLKRNGNLIGPNDLWIAATCLEHGLPLLTRNVREFERVPGLEILSY